MDGNVKAIQNMLFPKWKNSACLGYIIRAMENLDFEEDEINLVTSELREVFDFVSVEEAEQIYSKSSY